MQKAQITDMADLIREIRQRLELTQEQFAHYLGVTYLTVNRWENGHTKPSPIAMKLIDLKLREMGTLGKDLLDRFNHPESPTLSKFF